ncbi:branched-chain amino acid transport system II carrier protein, partial [Brevibacterium paucivorans]
MPFRTVIALGLMFFAVFMGAGNIIFPPLLGQQSG